MVCTYFFTSPSTVGMIYCYAVFTMFRTVLCNVLSGLLDSCRHRYIAQCFTYHKQLNIPSIIYVFKYSVFGYD